MKIPLYKPWIRRKDMDSVLSCMVDDSIGPGLKSSELCLKISEMLGLSGAFSLCEYARSIELVFKTLELSDGDEVLVSPLVSAVYYDVLSTMDVVVKVVDVAIENACFNSLDIESKISENTKAIILDRPLGFVPDLEKILDLGIPVIDDISKGFCPVASEDEDVLFGDYVILSMDSESFLTSGSGALVLAKDKKNLSKLKKQISIMDKSFLLSDLNASLGLIQCESVLKSIETRQQIADVFEKSIMKTRHKTFLKNTSISYSDFCFPVIVESNVKDVISYAGKKGISVKYAFSDVFINKIENNEVLCKNAEYLIMRTVLFPIYPTLGKKNINQISKVLSTLP